MTRSGKLLILLAVLFVAAFWRGFKLGIVPTGFFCDEAAFGVNAYSILTRGTDQFGKSYPFFFRSFGDYKEAIPTYSIVPLVYLFGLTEWSVRLMSAVYGVINVLLLYALGSALKGARVGLVAAFVGATMPWMFHYDRVAFHCSPYLTTLLAALLCLITGVKGAPLRIWGFFSFLALSLYTYSPSKLMVPLIVLIAVGLYWRFFAAKLRYTLLGLVSFGLISFPFVSGIRSGEALGRVSQLRLLDPSKFSWRGLDFWLGNYEAQILFSTLFTRGEPSPITRHLTNFFPPLLAATAPFLIVGLLSAIRERGCKEWLLILLLVAVFPLGATFTGQPFTHRSVLGAPLMALLIALGVEGVVSYAARRGFVGEIGVTALCFLTIAGNAVFYFQHYVQKYPLTSSGTHGWQYGPGEAIRYFREHAEEYDEFILGGAFNAPVIFFPFYAPDGFCDRRCLVGDFRVYKKERRQLFAVPPAYVTQNEAAFSMSPRHVVLYPDGTTALIVGSITPKGTPG
jgi:4-amino-4-deoxy-L-arabinose transferase-like glycosyltransferase